MPATEVLIGHHDQLRGLLDTLSGVPASAPRRRRDVLAGLAAELGMHEQLEDELFYPAARHRSSLVGIAHAEHRVLDDQLATLIRVDPSDGRFAVELAAFAAALTHHAGAEESAMFPEVAAKLTSSEDRELAERLQGRLDQLRASPVTRVRLQAKFALLSRL